ncbi:Gti1/Pac2 family-domain-containing protein [Ephemerocybe angulata]|uniref:Gti1/Pac2 family-domain-containing protein n=1 Tax=Ephemerocybe angulata TaxID=980116 RepID=A0A8H6I1F7_9AGAR|nr:Gti1/Pac2 family-domain-containing protein [Tulosesus angulatus]
MTSPAITHPSLHIRDAHDAHVVLEAVRLNILPLIKRRLLSNEREDLRSGHVYVWEEAQDDGGLLRWTDGRRWSQSRMRGDYLFYEEKIETTQDERDAKAARRACRAADPNAAVPPPVRRKDRPSKPNGLTKQTYSVTVHLPGSGQPRKWHVVAYFSGNDYIHLPTIERYDYLRNVRVPPGVYLSNKVLCTRTDRFSYYSDESEMHHDDGAASPPCLSPYPSPSPCAKSSPVISLPRLFMPVSNPNRITLPPISTLDSKGRVSSPQPLSPYPLQSSPGNYTPLSPEDKRALDSFRVLL